MSSKESKFKKGDVCRVIANYYSNAYDCMVGKIVTIDCERKDNAGYYYIKEPYWYIGNGFSAAILLNVFREDELELIEKIEPKSLLLKKLIGKKTV